MTWMKAAPQAFVMAMTFVLGFGSPLQADPIRVTYGTTGVVGATSLDGSPVAYWPDSPAGSQTPGGSVGIVGSPVISFQGVDNGTLMTGQPFNLGQFVVSSMPAGTSTTYNHTPFQIALTEQTINGAAPSPNGTPVVLDGWLSGTVSAHSPLELQIGINVWNTPVQGTPFPMTIPAFQAGNYLNYLLVSSLDSTDNMLQAQLNLVQSVPEPGAILVFGAVGVALLHFGRRRFPRPT